MKRDESHKDPERVCRDRREQGVGDTEGKRDSSLLRSSVLIDQLLILSWLGLRRGVDTGAPVRSSSHVTN